MLCRYVKQYALTLEYFVYLINVFEIHKISVIIANKRQEEKLATSTFKSMSKYDDQVPINNFGLVSSSTGGKVRHPISGYLGMFSAMMTSVRLLVCLHFKEKAPAKHRKTELYNMRAPVVRTLPWGI